MQEETTELVPQKQEVLINVGSMPQTAEEIYSYVKYVLVMKATPLKEKSLELHRQISEELPEKWEDWTLDNITDATSFYDIITSHLKTITDKTRMTEFDDLRDKAHKLKTGIIDAIKDIVGQLSSQDAKDWQGDKEILAFKIRKWRNREEEKAKAEALSLMRIAKEQEEERRLQEALDMEAEAIRMRQEGNIEQAEEIKQEAEALMEEKVFVPPPIVQNTIPKGGPKRQKFWKFKVDLKLLLKGIVAGRVPISAVLANDVLIGNQVRKFKDELNWDGVTVWPE